MINDTDTESNIAEQERRNIEDLGSVETKNPRGNIHCLNIIGQVEGHMVLPPQNKTTKYEHVLPQLIAEMIAGMSKPTVSLVLGGGHSIGVPLAVATDYSFIAPTATMTVHPLRMNGVVIGVMQTFQYFQNMQDRIIDFVVSNSNITYDKFKQLMLTTDEIANDVGSILFAKKAVEYGLINEMGGLKDALEKMYELIEKERENKK